ncbi:hypothetical protein EW146_g9939 [Bondarzewia mesenterica]|uniref:Translin n=1 Tax=Bondarzewia mesenterica TaxID=1095465 RepID=A0A4S4L3A4_9AGAM|nr:hypothetical protein EW146_g9939 [Bondarzewia mesenterica]
MAAASSSSSSSTILDAFDAFRDQLDEHNDRRERLIKVPFSPCRPPHDLTSAAQHSRDVTNLSKKVIFLLHRIMTAPSSSTTDPRSLALHAAREGRAKLRDIQLLYKSIRPELAGDRFWRYQHNVSPGLQEYIEALSFAHYLDHGTLITHAQVQSSLSDEEGPYFPLPVSDYLLGLSDLTGELMRFAISSLSKRGGRTRASEISNFVHFEGFTPHIRDLSKKQQVTSQSLQKIEQGPSLFPLKNTGSRSRTHSSVLFVVAAYAIAVRSSEYDLPPEIIDDVVSTLLSRFDTDDASRGTGRRGRRRDDDGDDDVDFVD